MDNLEQKGLNLNEGFSLLTDIELEQVSNESTETVNIDDEIESIGLVIEEEQIDKMLDLNNESLNRQEKAQYPFIKVEGFSINDEVVFFLDMIDSNGVKENDAESVPVVGLIKGKLIKAGFMHIDFDSIMKLKMVKDYKLTLVQEKDDELVIDGNVLKGLLLS